MIASRKLYNSCVIAELEIPTSLDQIASDAVVLSASDHDVNDAILRKNPVGKLNTGHYTAGVYYIVIIVHEKYCAQATRYDRYTPAAVYS